MPKDKKNIETKGVFEKTFEITVVQLFFLHYTPLQLLSNLCTPKFEKQSF